MTGDGDDASSRQRGREAVLAGYQGDETTARSAFSDPSPAVRVRGLGSLARLGALRPDDVARALRDPMASVRRRACEVAVTVTAVDLVPAVADPDFTVAEAAAWALGERAEAAGPDAVAALAEAAVGHDDALVREAAVAALGAIGDQAGLSAILAACGDRPAVRRRAVIALAPFSGPAVDEALERALTDRDWQVRQAAEDLH